MRQRERQRSERGALALVLVCLWLAAHSIPSSFGDTIHLLLVGAAALMVVNLVQGRE